MIDLPKLAISLLVSEFIDMSVETKDRIAIFIQELCREIHMGRLCPIMHYISEEEKRIVLFSDSCYFPSYHFDPFVEYLLEIVGSYLRADNITILDRIFDRLDEFCLMCLDTK